MKKNGFILMVVTACVIFSCSIGSGHKSVDELVEEAQQVVHLMSPQEILTLMESDTVYTLVDVREKDEHYYGYVPGSVLIPRGSIEFNIGDEAFWEHEGLYMPTKDEIIILYCKKGKRSVLTAKTLSEMGYEKVYVLKDGWKNWELTYPNHCEKDLDMLAGGGHKEEVAGGC